MQFSNAPGKIPLPFAASGGKNTIPQQSQILITPGAASLTDGFPPLTRTLISAGGVPPSGLDMNGILYETTAISTWANAGAGYKFDSTFAGNSAVGGYPATARVARSDGLGYWINTVDNNTTDPESSGAAAAGWFPDTTTGAASITMTNANVTLTPLQYGQPVIIITGTLTANLNLIFPGIVGEWVIINSTTGSYTITAKTSGGTGVAVSGTSSIAGDGTNIYAVAPPTISNFYTAGTSTGSANAHTLASLSPATGFSLSNNGQTIGFTSGYTNTGATTLAITSPSISATSIKKDGGSGLVALTGGEIVAGNNYFVTVNTTSSCFVLQAGIPSSLFLQAANNLNDVPSPSTALANLGGIGASALPIRGSQVYTSGSGNFTVPSTALSTTRFKFTVTGGGGAGGGISCSAGGGAGATAIYYVTGLTASSTCAYSIGGGGSGSSGAAGGSGTSTTITVNGTTITGGGGTGGNNTVTSNGGAGGSSTNGTININGGYGTPGNGNGVNGNLGGSGGASFWGGGSTGSSTTTGVNAVAYGSGGGATGGTTGTSGTGGNGAGGIILIEWD